MFEMFSSNLMLIFSMLYLIIYGWYFFVIRPNRRKKEGKSKERIFSIFNTAISKDNLFDLDYIKTVKKSIEREEDEITPLSSLLEDYIVHLSTKEEQKGNITVLFEKIKLMLDTVNEEMPFSKLPENERRLMTNIKSNLMSGDKELAIFNLNELCTVTSLNHNAYLREKTINSWSVPLGILGVIVSIFFGIISMSGNKMDDSINEIKSTVASENIKLFTQLRDSLGIITKSNTSGNMVQKH